MDSLRWLHIHPHNELDIDCLHSWPHTLGQPYRSSPLMFDIRGPLHNDRGRSLDHLVKILVGKLNHKREGDMYDILHHGAPLLVRIELDSCYCMSVRQPHKRDHRS